MNKKKSTAIRLILWNHLSHDISTLSDLDLRSDPIVFLETLKEAESVNHHVKKLAFLFSAMRHFAEELKRKKCVVHYTPIQEEERSLSSGMQKILQKWPAERIVVAEPGDYQTLQEIQTWEKKFKIPVEIRPDNRFFLSLKEFTEWSQGKKKLRMETFYEFLRKKTGYLLDPDGTPKGGQWNFDKENRNPIRSAIHPPEPFHVAPDSITKEVLREVKSRFSKHFGDLLPFWFAVTEKDAKRAFDHFLQKALPHFGTYQDAMQQDESFLYHSVISHYLNAGLLGPKQVCDAVEKACLRKKVPIESAEGFIRQILGWREYIRGIYWLKMPKLGQMNFLGAKRKLPWFYWSGETEMNCLRQTILQTKKNAYSHHIQRLMVTGNFALLIGVAPKEVSDWYLSVYADAHEWVELPNTLAMSQFADGGFLATKPYASSGSYIDKMSNFCKTCRYNVRLKQGEKACPFNYLYWYFLIRNQKKLKNNVRLAMPYQLLSRFSAAQKKQIVQDAKRFLKSLA
jgi:deoxyribodipyrimidine photolyase-related protein